MSNRQECIKKINTLLYSFVWKGKDKVKCTVLISPTEKDGLKMISTKRIICIKRYLSLARLAGRFFWIFT